MFNGVPRLNSDITFRVDDFSYKNFFIGVRTQKLCPFYKFSRDFANNVEIHICKFSQLDHISHGKLIFFYFFDISIIFVYFFKTEKAIGGGRV